MSEARSNLKLGLVYGFAAAVPVVVLSYPVLEPLGLLGPATIWHELTVTLGAYVLSNFVYLPSEGFFHVGQYSPSASASMFYSLPVISLTFTGYLTARNSDTESAVSSVLHGSLSMTGYMLVFVAAFFVYYVEFGIRDTGPAEVVLLYILPVMVYTTVLAGVGGGLNRMIPRCDDADFDLREAAHLGLAVLLLSTVVMAGVALAPEDDFTSTITAGMSMSADAGDESFSATVEKMGNADYVYLVGDHTLESDPVLNETGETLVLPEEHLNESGSITAVGVIGGGEFGRDHGYRVLNETGVNATETALQTEKWNFTSTR